MLLFLMILIKALLGLPLFYIGTLLVVFALTLRKRLAIPDHATCQKATDNVQHMREGGRAMDSLPQFYSFTHHFDRSQWGDFPNYSGAARFSYRRI
ncbi:MAG: hypothetical protein JO331_09205 [Verrucomicrobia bacterium]|nr:hypothetical protein [Verrucomicrobiota bacterium]